MKKFLLMLMLCFIGISTTMAKSPKVITDMASNGIKVVNDSTIVYYETYKIMVVQPDNVYTAIFKLPSPYETKKGVLPTLMVMSFGTYTFVAPSEGNYILYASKSFDKILYRRTEYIECDR